MGEVGRDWHGYKLVRIFRDMLHSALSWEAKQGDVRPETNSTYNDELETRTITGDPQKAGKDRISEGRSENR